MSDTKQRLLYLSEVIQQRREPTCSLLLLEYPVSFNAAASSVVSMMFTLYNPTPAFGTDNYLLAWRRYGHKTNCENRHAAVVRIAVIYSCNEELEQTRWSFSITQHPLSLPLKALMNHICIIHDSRRSAVRANSKHTTTSTKQITDVHVCV